MRRSTLVPMNSLLVLLVGTVFLAGCLAGQGVYGPGSSRPPSSTYPPSSGSGAGSRPWVPPSASPTVRVAVLPGVLDFGRVPEGSSSSVEALVRNDGNVRVRVSRVTLAGGRTFALKADRCTGAWLSPGRSCAFEVGFLPRGPGSYDGAVEIYLEDPYGRFIALPLRGEGDRPRFPVIRVEPNRLEFGDHEPNDLGTAQVEVRNIGSDDLAIKGVSVNGQGFSRREDSCSGRNLPPGRSCGVKVGFAPPGRGAFSGVLAITSNDPTDHLLNVPLAGTGRSTRFPDIRVRPDRLDFGRVASGAGPVLEAEVRNGGNDELVIREVSVNGLGFALAGDGCSGRTIPSGRSCTIRVAFRPAGAGSFSGILGIVSNDPDERLTSVTLVGSAEPPRPSERTCPVEKIRPFRGRDADEPLLLSGSLRRDGCVTYAFKVEKKGVLTVCTPPGYSVAGEGFTLVPEENCTLPKDRTVYRTWRRTLPREGTDIRDLTITREERGAKEFKFLFSFTPEEGERGMRRGN